MTKEEVGIEVTFRRKYNLGNWNDKEYTVKLSGTDSQISQQLSQEKQKLINYIGQLEEIVDVANDANKLKARLEQSPKPETEKLKEL